MAKKTRKHDDEDDNDKDQNDVPRKKRGQPTDFKGQHLEFLTDKIPDYLAAAKIKGKEAKKSGLPVFWMELFHEYWVQFPWDLPFDKDPDPSASLVPSPGSAEEGITSSGPSLTPEESEKKSKIKKDMKGVHLDCLFVFILVADSRFTTEN
jgi:hypothetical protein